MNPCTHRRLARWSVGVAVLSWLALAPAISHAWCPDCDAYEKVLRADGDALLTRFAERRAILAKPEFAMQHRALVDSLSTHIHCGGAQVVSAFNDPSYRLEIPASRHLDYTDAFSYGVWLWLEADGMVAETKIIYHAGVATGKASLTGFGRNVIVQIRYQDDAMVTLQAYEEIPVRQWVHVGVSFERDEGPKIYIGGELARTRVIHDELRPSLPVLSVPEQPLYVGGFDRNFPGRLDDLRIYGTALPPAAFARLAAGDDVTDGLLGHWPLDDLGDVAVDRSSYANAAIVGESVSVDQPGRLGKSMAFSRNEDTWARELTRLQSRVAALTARVNSTIEPMHTDVLNPILERLEKHHAALVHFRAETNEHDAVTAWIVDPEQSAHVRVVELPLSAKWHTARKAFLTELRAPRRGQSSDRAVREAGRAVARELWDPLAPLLGERREVWLRLTPLLKEIPFAALLDENDDFLVEHYAFARCGPVTALGKAPASQLGDEPPRAVAFADPYFVDTSSPQPIGPERAPTSANRQAASDGMTCAVRGPSLFGTQLEVEAVRAILRDNGFDPVDVFQRVDARESLLDSVVSGAAIVHVATHGYQIDGDCLPAVPTDPLYMSGLVLAGAMRIVPERSRGSNEGLLSAAEIAELDLSSAELLVWSGCETAIGAGTADEALSGLPAAGWLAGAGASVATLWPVSDDMMPLQIESFYSAWLNGASVARAQQAALLAGMATTENDRGHSHPAWWGGGRGGRGAMRDPASADSWEFDAESFTHKLKDGDASLVTWLSARCERVARPQFSAWAWEWIRDDFVGDLLLQLTSAVRGDAFHIRGQPGAYVDTAIRNLCRQYFLELARIRRQSSLEVSGTELASGHRHSLARVAVAIDLRHALDRLSPECRRLIERKYVVGLDLKAIGNEVGVSEKTARSRLHQCREKLRRLWEKISTSDLRTTLG